MRKSERKMLYFRCRKTYTNNLISRNTYCKLHIILIRFRLINFETFPGESRKFYSLCEFCADYLLIELSSFIDQIYLQINMDFKMLVFRS